VATIRERSPDVWQVRVFAGRNGTGRPTQMAVTVRGGKRDVLREAARLESTPQRGAEGRTVADALSAWLERNEGSYTPASRRDQTGRVRSVTEDQISAWREERLRKGAHASLTERGTRCRLTGGSWAPLPTNATTRTLPGGRFNEPAAVGSKVARQVVRAGLLALSLR